MFICSDCHKPSLPYEKPVFGRVTRSKIYPYREYANPGRGQFGHSTDDPGGKGFETVEEFPVCPRCTPYLGEVPAQ